MTPNTPQYRTPSNPMPKGIFYVSPTGQDGGFLPSYVGPNGITYRTGGEDFQASLETFRVEGWKYSYDREVWGRF